MPELQVKGQKITLNARANLLDSLLAAGVDVPYSCRAGACHACLVRCLSGDLEDEQPEVLTAEQRRQGWRLACQCRVVEDVCIEPFDPRRDAIRARVQGCDWLSPSVLRLRLQPERPLRYTAGQHIALCTLSGVIRPYSLASLPGDDSWLEFHIDCRRTGAFTRVARQLQVGDELGIGALHSAGLHYDPQWQSLPLLFIASGTGLAPLYGLLREALRQGHTGPIRLMHVAPDEGEHYLKGALFALADEHPHVQLDFVLAANLSAALAELRLVPRQTIALLCGHPDSVERFARHLYLAGLPRNRIVADSFLPPASSS